MSKKQNLCSQYTCPCGLISVPRVHYITWGDACTCAHRRIFYTPRFRPVTDIEAAKAIVKEKGEAVAQLKSAKAGKAEITASVVELDKAKENLSRLEERSKIKPGIPEEDGKIDYS